MQLQALEQALASAKLWQITPIDPQLLQSTQPFCCDTLQFEQWLQFVFIPKMSALIAQDLPLPTNIAIAPMAQMTLSDQANYDVILSILEQIDNSLSQSDVC
ncbi:YqcC family protein [Pseudoalteromonas sp. JBTF-M23]|uniref:YqcC family protein n=1 Tax=Pseudoalteromonas caenipelagi TaxID=2726988 RepID=A0A849VBL4_9GAMM|nr:YqcC family protein [Pseudoalteromonas caenipelagi]NOU50676.1 YqcC family protein [Pseudoalteromonas caenipelagi]